MKSLIKTWNELFTEKKFSKSDILNNGFIFSKFPEYFPEISIFPDNEKLNADEQKTIYDIDLFSELGDRYVTPNIEKMISFFDNLSYEDFVKQLMIIINRNHYSNWKAIYKNFIWEYEHGSNYDLTETREVKHTGNVTRVETNEGTEGTVSSSTNVNTGTDTTTDKGTNTTTDSGTNTTTDEGTNTTTDSGTDTTTGNSAVVENKTDTSRYAFNSVGSGVPTETVSNSNTTNNSATQTTEKTTTATVENSTTATVENTSTESVDKTITLNVERTSSINADSTLTRDLINNATDTYNTTDTETISRIGDLSVRAIQDTLQLDIDLWKTNVFYNIVLENILSSLTLSIWKGGE